MIHSKKGSINLLTTNVPTIETNQLICSANQPTGFYKKETLVVKRLKSEVVLCWSGIPASKYLVTVTNQSNTLICCMLCWIFSSLGMKTPEQWKSKSFWCIYFYFWRYLANTYLFKVNKETLQRVWNMFKVNNRYIRTNHWRYLVSFLITLKIFDAFFLVFLVDVVQVNIF